MTDKLKPVNCGCGGEAVLETDHDTIQPVAPIDWKRVRCNKCNIRTTWRRSEALAIETWNRAMSGSTEKSSTVERTAKVEKIHMEYASEGDFDIYECGDCGNCGETVMRGDKFCHECGARLEWNE